MKRGTTSTRADGRAHDVVELLRDLLHRLLMASIPAWLDLPLTLPQLRAVFVVAHNTTSSLMQVAQNLGVGEPTASHLIDRLVQAGLVERSEDPRDRRRAVVQLSTRGEELIGKLLGWENVLGAWLQKIPANDLASLARGLRAVRESLGRKDPHHDHHAHKKTDSGSQS